MTSHVGFATRLQYDVVILGGGLAGLTLARQLAMARPGIRMLVVEKHTYPVPEAAFKVGESSAEVGAHYFGRILGLKGHLQTQHLRKMGLRFFATAGDNRDIVQRVEHGPPRYPPVPGFQLDRGRLENHLAEESAGLGIDLLEGTSVREVILDDAGHHVRIRQDGSEQMIACRWVVDATGRTGFLKRALGLAEPVDHDVNAVWFRVNSVIDVDEWSEDAAWHARVPRGLRHFSTCHLAGRGYWVWLIPLAGDITSVGIVADPSLHSLSELTHFDGALAWLQRHEPQLAARVEAARDRIMDFKALRHFAAGCKQVYAAQRWALIGEAGPFTDPLYSPGSDFIAIGNTFVTDLILRDLQGEDITQRAAHHNDLYLALFRDVLGTFEGQYPLFGNPQALMAKVVWDQGYWWSVPGLLFFRHKLIDPQFMESIRPLLLRHTEVQRFVQNLLRHWDTLVESKWRGGHVSFGIDEFPVQLHNRLAAPYTDRELLEVLEENVLILETVAVFYWHEAVRCAPLLERLSDLHPMSALPHAVVSFEWAAIDALVPPSVRRVWQEQFKVPALSGVS